MIRYELFGKPEKKNCNASTLLYTSTGDLPPTRLIASVHNIRGKNEWKTTYMAAQTTSYCLWSHICCFSFKICCVYCVSALFASELITSYSSNWIRLLLLCTIAPLVLCCDRFDRGSRQVKRDPVDLVTVDYAVTLRYWISRVSF